ncbi:hypothetical protein Q7C36_003431 [Tachysurus vachellii]|uniref:Lipocalin/cytosolic fatty-acid binding domain-containing protein n=1 Tax=Tachysurus vachellii TaxID=175792 RepID=A0AA88NV33_TACVA|nr:hypothetical protein Q7C36_003431 [Tachysurus vachellii]
MDKFIATWKLVSAENFDEYMKAFRIADELREVSRVIKPKLTISQAGDTVVFNLDSLFTNQKSSFKLGEEFQAKTMVGTDCKVTVILDRDRLIEVSKSDESESCCTMTYQDIVAVRTFDKV